jgi:hypothetical protein
MRRSTRAAKQRVHGTPPRHELSHGATADGSGPHGFLIHRRRPSWVGEVLPDAASGYATIAACMLQQADYSSAGVCRGERCGNRGSDRAGGVAGRGHATDHMGCSARWESPSPSAWTMRPRIPRRPANKGGFIFALFMIVPFVAGLFIVDDLSDRTRRGFPIGVLLVLGAICFAIVAVRSWLGPYSED